MCPKSLAYDQKWNDKPKMELSKVRHLNTAHLRYKSIFFNYSRAVVGLVYLSQNKSVSLHYKYNIIHR